jgi:hypothetical protein
MAQDVLSAVALSGRTSDGTLMSCLRRRLPLKQKTKPPQRIRQAVVIVHGMGEQRPLETLNRFILAALAPEHADDRFFFSRPDTITQSYESRVFLAPRQPPGHGPEVHAQTEFYEYHWAHLMQGNRLDDMWPTFRHLLLTPPNKVPSGLRVVWALFWLAFVTVGVFLWRVRTTLSLSHPVVEQLVRVIVGGGVTAGVLTYIATRILPGWITTSFVDVVRYLDTSPRSYEVRRQIRKGMIELLQKLHTCGRYQRIVIVAHSLGAFIAYDGISYLWQHTADLLNETSQAKGPPQGLQEVERTASELLDRDGAGGVTAYQDAQHKLFMGLRNQCNPWLITDFITLGTPMYCADRLLTKTRRQFDARIARGELVTCPPRTEGTARNNLFHSKVWFSWKSNERRLMYDGAPFAVVQWTNLWFPAVLGFFGDWFGGPLAPLFGPGIRDIAVKGNRKLRILPPPPASRLLPGYAHALYFSFPDDTSLESVTTKLRQAMALASSHWLERIG